jgi:hypothetical protein
MSNNHSFYFANGHIVIHLLNYISILYQKNWNALPTDTVMTTVYPLNISIYSQWPPPDVYFVTVCRTFPAGAIAIWMDGDRFLMIWKFACFFQSAQISIRFPLMSWDILRVNMRFMRGPHGSTIGWVIGTTASIWGDLFHLRSLRTALCRHLLTDGLALPQFVN